MPDLALLRERRSASLKELELSTGLLVELVGFGAGGATCSGCRPGEQARRRRRWSPGGAPAAGGEDVRPWRHRRAAHPGWRRRCVVRLLTGLGPVFASGSLGVEVAEVWQVRLPRHLFVPLAWGAW